MQFVCYESAVNNRMQKFVDDAVSLKFISTFTPTTQEAVQKRKTLCPLPNTAALYNTSLCSVLNKTTPL